MATRTYPNGSKIMSVYATRPLNDALAVRGAAGSQFSKSMALTAMVDRYATMVKKATPAFTRSEWLLIFDVLNNAVTWADAGLLDGVLYQEVYDAIDLHALDRKWKVKPSGLLETLQGLTFLEQVAVVDAAERFWSSGKKFTEPSQVVGLGRVL